jgi:hypothetical protein
VDSVTCTGGIAYAERSSADPEVAVREPEGRTSPRQTRMYFVGRGRQSAERDHLVQIRALIAADECVQHRRGRSPHTVLPMHRSRVVLAVLAAVAAVGVAWLTFVVWVFAGISYSMDAGEETAPLGGWGVLAFGAAITFALLWA